ncbi:MAG: tRNA lysidine(34) synthetase TilS [Rhodobacteraceae bacterium]|nr:tRNA lysidine(34) synthetase TilS [Paracoccaceae bacterium]
MAAALGALPAGAPTRLGVAVSGGSDSLALLVLAADWARARGADLYAVSVDHGLRPEAAAECAQVAVQAAALGIPHQTLRWRDWDGQGNLQAAARRARQRLIADWAIARGLRHVALAHTLDDQAETVLLRLARGSGVDGLSAMAPMRRDPAADLIWLRPLLGVRRAALRSLLAERGLVWSDDPGNADNRFDRVKARAVLADPPLPGLGPERLAETAERMSAARLVLDRVARQAADRLARTAYGAVSFDAAGLTGLPDDTRWRLLSAALRLVSGDPYRPRLSALRRAEETALGSGRSATLLGCILQPARGGRLWVLREPAALRPGPVPGLWDGRWRIDGPAEGAVLVAPLGEAGLAEAGDWRALGVPHKLALGLPGIWQNGRLRAAPVLDPPPPAGPAWTATAVWDPGRLSVTLIPD